MLNEHLFVEADDGGDLVFFDFLGWFMISYTAKTGVIINVIMCVVSCVIIVLSLIGIRKQSGKYRVAICDVI